jgi:hypothetical protein
MDPGLARRRAPLSNLHRGVLFCALDGVSDESGRQRVLGVVRAVHVPIR